MVSCACTECAARIDTLCRIVDDQNRLIQQQQMMIRRLTEPDRARLGSAFFTAATLPAFITADPDIPDGFKHRFEHFIDTPHCRADTSIHACTSHAQTEAATGQPTWQWTQVLGAMAQIAQDKIGQAGFDDRISGLLGQPLQSRNVAKAYDLLGMVRPESKGTSLKHLKKALVYVRDLLNLTVFVGEGGYRQGDAVEETWGKAFGRNLEDKEKSQLFGSLKKMIHLSQTETEFEESIEEMALDQDFRGPLLHAYKHLVCISPLPKSRRRKRGQKKKKPLLDA